MNRKKRRCPEEVRVSYLIHKVRRGDQGKGRQSPTPNLDPTENLTVTPGGHSTHTRIAGTPLPGGSGTPCSQPALPNGGREHPHFLVPAGHASCGHGRRPDRVWHSDSSHSTLPQCRRQLEEKGGSPGATCIVLGWPGARSPPSHKPTPQKHHAKH